MSCHPKKPRFFIENILGLIDNPREENQFYIPIENLLISDQDEQPIQIGTGNIGRFIEKIDSQKLFCKRFKLMKTVSKFSIKSLPQNPENLLRHVLDNCINQSINDAKENGIVVDHLGATISSLLLDSDIWIPIRALHDDTVENILQRFLLVGQSKAERGSLLGELFTVSIHSLDVSALPKEKSISGKGPSIITTATTVPIPSWIIKIKNIDNNYCLFYALELKRKYVSY